MSWKRINKSDRKKLPKSIKIDSGGNYRFTGNFRANIYKEVVIKNNKNHKIISAEFPQTMWFLSTGK